MKKNGFTLAEVLITLAIIGVVAVLTLPALMTNTQEQRAKTALKKGINTLTEAGQMNASIAGFDYSSITSNDTKDQDEQSLFGILANRTSMDFANSNTMKNTKQKSFQGSSTSQGADNYVAFFRDGSSLIFNPAMTGANDTANTKNKVGTPQDDGLPYGIPAIYDTNGVQGPNILSYCMGSDTTINNPLGNTTDSTVDDVQTACPKKGRLIKDQFGIRLRGYYAVPNGAAARWAFSN